MAKFNLQEFKRDYYEAGEENMMGQIPHLARLAEEYRVRATMKKDVNKNWMDYLKAHSLYNSCLARDGEKAKWHPKLYQVEVDFHRGALPVSEISHAELIQQLKGKLRVLREEVCARQSTVKETVEKLDTEDEFSESNLELLRLMSSQVFENSDFCTNKMQWFCGEIMNASVSLIGTPPCSYCAVALGSIARGEATPYSDLEYVFLIELDEHRPYFHRLAVTSYFLINNLGETPLKCMYFEELHDHFGDEEKEKRWFIEQTINGFKIDGITPRAGNVPTGKGGQEDDVWIKTPTELSNSYEHVLQKRAVQLSQMDQGVLPKGPSCLGDKADLLRSTVVIHSSGDKSNELYQEFCLYRDTVSKKYQAEASGEAQLNALKTDMDKYNFVPDYQASHEQKQQEVKTDIFRHPTLLLHNLRMIYSLDSAYSHNVLDALIECSLITQDGHFMVSILLSIGLHVRLAAYLAFGMQRGSVTFLNECSQDSVHPDRYCFPRGLFVIMAVIMSNIKQKFESHGVIEALGLLQLSPLTGGSNNSKAEALYFCGDYRKCLSTIERLYGIKSTRDVESTCSLIKSMCDLYTAAIQSIWMLASALSRAGQPETSNMYFRKLLADESGLNEFAATDLMMLMGNNYLVLGEYREAYDSFENALGLHNSVQGETTYHHRKADILNNIGVSYQNMGDFAKAIEHFKKSLTLYNKIYGETADHRKVAASLNNLGSNYHHIGDHQTALRYYNMSLKMHIRLHGETAAHPTTASTLSNVGSTYEAMGDHRQAGKCYERLLKMLRAIHGVTSDHPSIASALSNIGVHYSFIGDYRNAYMYYQQSLSMHKRLYGRLTDHPKIADTLNNIGNNFNRMRDYTKADEYFNRALSMYRKIYGESDDHPYIANTLKNMGHNYQDLPNHEKAERSFMCSLEMYRRIYGETTDHPKIADTLGDMGMYYNRIKDYTKAEDYHQKSLDMSLRIHGEKCDHHSIACSLNNLGIHYKDKREYQNAVNYYQRSLGMYKRIYGETTDHPIIAGILLNLAGIFLHTKDYHKALECYKQSLNMKRRIYGENITHPEIAAILNNMGTIHHSLGDFKQAVESFQQSMVMKRRLHGEETDHLDIVKGLNNIAIEYRCMGDQVNAREYSVQARQMVERLNQKTEHS